MVFVTVGTHEQQFNRLVEYVDNMVVCGILQDEVIIQTGYSTYQPQQCEWQNFYPYPQVEAFVQKADIVITHGGPSSFLMPLMLGKIPIVVPRQAKYGEHVNDHQLVFCRQMVSRMGKILVVEDIEDLKNKITCYHEIISGMGKTIESGNAEFKGKLGKLVDELSDY